MRRRLCYRLPLLSGFVEVVAGFAIGLEIHIREYGRKSAARRKTGARGQARRVYNIPADSVQFVGKLTENIFAVGRIVIKGIHNFNFLAASE